MHVIKLKGRCNGERIIFHIMKPFKSRNHNSLFKLMFDFYIVTAFVNLTSPSQIEISYEIKKIKKCDEGISEISEIHVEKAKILNILVLCLGINMKYRN